MLTGRGPSFVRAARALVFVALSLAAAAPAAAQFCSNCILNSASPQIAQFNVTSATVRGILTVGTLNTTALTVSGTMTAALFSGSGASLTALNASALGSGTVPSARVAGAYTGITQVGTLTAGVWNGTIITPAYGGTGANLSISGTAGGLPYFTGSGIQGVVTSPAGPRVLATAGSGAKPVWVSSPALTGENFSAIPLTALDDGTLPTTIAVDDDSLSTVSAAKVVGNISGRASGLTIALPISDLAAGTLPTSNAASSITVTGVTPGTFGGPTTLAQIQVRTDGRIQSIAQFPLVVYSTQVAPGPLPAGVTIPAAQVSSGTLAGDVIASSIAATAVTAGSYGAASRTLTLTVGVDGRLSAVAQPLIALPLSQLNNGTLPSGVKLPAASVNAGSLGATVIASSVAANGVTPGTYGSPTASAQFTVGPDGRITSITSFAIPGVSTSAAWVDRFNDWSYPQTSRSSWTFTNASGIKVNAAVTAGSFSGSGVSITNLTPANMNAGTLPADVIASSVAARKVGDPQLTVTGVTAGTKGSASRSATIVVDAQGRITSLTDSVIAISTGEFVGIVQTAQGGTGADWSAVASGGVPYFSGTGAMSVLAKSVNGYSLVQSGGLPVWAAAVSSATNLAGGALGSLPYQSAANTTALLAAGTGVLQETGGAPSWTQTPNITGVGIQGQNLDMGSHRIVNVTDPSSDQDAATKFYVDSIANGLQWKTAARLATAAALPTNLYSNGSSGVGATLTGTAIGALTIDGVAVAVGNRVLIKDEVDGTHNGIYTVTQNGAGVVYILTRAVDYNSAAEMDQGTALFITAGTVNADMGFVQINAISTVGSDALSFTQFTGLGEVTAGTGLTKTANTMSLITPVTVANGGTGAATLTSHGVVLGNGTSALSSLPAMGALGIVVGNGTSVSPSTATLTGTSNQVVVTQSATAVTLSLPQSINSGAAPTFLGTNFTSIPAASINSGTLGSQVIASSVAATGVTAASYGSAALIPVLTIAGDGRVTSATTASVASSKYVQLVSTQTTGFFTGTGTIPYDNTIPQITEGFIVVTATITASSGSNNLVFNANVCATETSNSGDQVAMCLFKDTTANAIACTAGPVGADLTPCRAWKLNFVTTAVDTSAHVYTLKIGDNVGTLDINGAGGARVYGGALVSGMTIEEVVP